MVVALGLAAVAAIIVFVAWLALRGRWRFNRTLRQIRRLPTFHGHRRVRK